MHLPRIYSLGTLLLGFARVPRRREVICPVSSTQLGTEERGDVNGI